MEAGGPWKALLPRPASCHEDKGPAGPRADGGAHSTPGATHSMHSMGWNPLHVEVGVTVPTPTGKQHRPGRLPHSVTQPLLCSPRAPAEQEAHAVQTPRHQDGQWLGPQGWHAAIPAPRAWWLFLLPALTHPQGKGSQK